jgi:ABC-2 type transport system ATP-binding protein
MDDVAALAKRVIVINNGLKIYDGLLSDLTEKMRPEKIITVILNSETFPKIEIPNVNIVSQESNLFRLKAPRENVGKLAAALYNTGLTIDLTIEDTPLEDIIGNLFTEKSNFQQFRTNV